MNPFQFRYVILIDVIADNVERLFLAFNTFVVMEVQFVSIVYILELYYYKRGIDTFDLLFAFLIGLTVNIAVLGNIGCPLFFIFGGNEREVLRFGACVVRDVAVVPY